MNVTALLKQLLVVTHQQLNLYTKIKSKMPDPTFEPISFDGIFLAIQVVYPDPKMLSQSLTDK